MLQGWLPEAREEERGRIVEQVQKKAAAGSRTRSIAFVALTVAITAVSAWVTVPLGPVPFTLQIFAVAFMVLVLQPKEAVAAITVYLVPRAASCGATCWAWAWRLPCASR